MTSSAITVPAGLAALARRLAFDTAGWSRTGRVDLRVDRHPRITLRKGPRDSIEVEARLGPLPALPRDRDELVDRLMLRVTAGAAARVATLALSADASQLLLQARLHGQEAIAAEEGFEAFLNDLDYWSAQLGELR
jgi:Tir chaperone protein (CesT) family